MAHKTKKKLFDRPLIVFLLTLAALGVVLTILAMIDGKGSPLVIGTYFLYGGAIVVIIGFLFLNKGGIYKGDGDSQSEYRKNIEYFKKARAEEKLLERIIWPMILAALSLAVTGYFVNRFLAD